MIPYAELPKEKAALAEAVRRLVEQARPLRNARRAEWLLNYYYLEGIRNYLRVDHLRGTIRVSYANTQGTRGFRYEEVVSKYQAELGRLLRVDIAPDVKRRQLSLDAFRRASIAQIALDYNFTPSRLDQLKLDAFSMYLTYGMIGLQAVSVLQPDGYLSPEIEPVPPWELFPVPAEPSTNQALKGIVRSHWVPLDWLREQKDFTIPGEERIQDIEVRDVPFGAQPSPADAPSQEERGSAAVMGDFYESESPTVPSDDSRRFVRIEEVWMKDSEGRCLRYCVTSKKRTLHDRRYEEGERPPMPIVRASWSAAGGFYGRSFVSLLIPLNSEAEKLMEALYKNMRDLDNFGMMMVSTRSGINVNLFKANKRPKALAYEPDYASQGNDRPYNLTPVNTGLLPAKAVEFSLAAMDRIAQQGELFRGEAPGRVDSARGLGLLFETAAIPLGGPVVSLAAAFSEMYAAALYDLKHNWSDRKLASATFLDDALAGVVMDSESGEIELARNALPDPREVNISIKSKFPRSPEQDKTDLVDMLARGVITQREFRIEVRKRGLDLPVGSDIEWQNYLAAVLNNIKLFGDGETPGEIFEADYEMHEIHLERLTAFMSRPEFRLASRAVRDKFDQALAAREAMLGKLPEGAPTPDTVPDEARMMQEMQRQGMRGMEMQGAGQEGAIPARQSGAAPAAVPERP